MCAEVEKLDSEREAGNGREKLGMGEGSWEWEREAGNGRGKLGMGEGSWAWERRFWVRERKKKVRTCRSGYVQV